MRVFPKISNYSFDEKQNSHLWHFHFLPFWDPHLVCFSKRQRMLLLPVPERQKCLSVSNSDEDILAEWRWKKHHLEEMNSFEKNTNIHLNHRHQSKLLQTLSSWYKPSQPSEMRKVPQTTTNPPPQTITTSASDSDFAYHLSVSGFDISAWHSREWLMLRAHTFNYLRSWGAQKCWLALWE